MSTTDLEEAERRIAAADATGASELDLFGLNLDRLPNSLAALTGLQHLDLRESDRIRELEPILGLRKAMNRTQVEVAKALKVGQDTVSRYEKRSDMLLSTLQGYVEAMGGELDLVVTFPNRKAVKLKTLGEVAD